MKMLQKDPKKRISASEALASDFFATEAEIAAKLESPVLPTNQGLRERPPAVNVERNQSMESESPLMTTKNQARKQGRLRDDSCLKFKMKENIVKPEDNGDSIDQIDSPAILAKKGTKNPESRFKRMVHADNE